jgi:hypothetical protein
LVAAGGSAGPSIAAGGSAGPSTAGPSESGSQPTATVSGLSQAQQQGSTEGS